MMGREEYVGVALNKRLLSAREAWHVRQENLRSSVKTEENLAWEVARRLNTAAAYKAYLANPEYGMYRAKALRRLADIKGGAHEHPQVVGETASNNLMTPINPTSTNGEGVQVAVFFQTLFKGGAAFCRWLRRTLPLLNPVWRALGRFLTGCWHLVQKLLNGIERQLSSSFASPLVTLMFWAAGLVFAFVIFLWKVARCYLANLAKHWVY